MIQPWWAVGLAVPGLIVKGLVGGKSKTKKEDARTFRCATHLALAQADLLLTTGMAQDAALLLSLCGDVLIALTQ